MKHKIGVLGAGTWGMALARMLTVSGNEVQVWSALPAEVDSLSTTRVHPNLPGMKIPAELQFTKSIEEVCTGKDVLLFAVPSVFVRATAAKARPYIRSGQIIVDVAKGIEPDTLYTMTEILADELSHENGPRAVRLVALSGPTHAEEVALDLPTTMIQLPEGQEWVFEIINNILIEVLSSIAEQERLTIRQRQAEGIAAAQAQGRHLGRPQVEPPSNWDEVYGQWKRGEITGVKAMERLGLKRSTFYKFVRREEED